MLRSLRRRLVRVDPTGGPALACVGGLGVAGVVALSVAQWLHPLQGHADLGPAAVAVAIMLLVTPVTIVALIQWMPGRESYPSAPDTAGTPEAARDLVGWRARVQRVMEEPDLMFTLFQPIVDLSTGVVAGVEALTRFAPEPVRAPDEWFAEAARAGLRIPLELRALQLALGQLDRLPPGYLAVNLSPAAVVSAEFARLLLEAPRPFSRIVVEMTEPVPAGSYGELLEVLVKLRAAGARLAVDDGGSGYTNLQQILELRPDFIKVDRSFVSAAPLDPARRALVHAVVDFAADIGAVVVAEGVENSDELRTVRGAGITLAQGYLFGRPGRPPVTIAWQADEGRPLEALIVDDDAVVRALIVRIVRRAGITVVGQASDGEDAIRQATQLRPDVIVLDLGMPILTGKDALPTLRARLPRAHILVVSAQGHQTADQAASLRELGADRHIPKDLVVKHLPSILTGLVHTHGQGALVRTPSANGD
jgi:EAL domain-containing protein (putative c-di-GMP-specific phosphodiesterase class I)